jgi:tetratricopeptide (TPR) repeat protein
LVEVAGNALSVDATRALLEEALAELRATGDEIGRGKALLLIAHGVWVSGDTRGSNALLAEAVDVLERHEPGPELTHAYSLSAARNAIAGDPNTALEWAEKGIALAQQLGLEHFVARIGQFRGMARCELGDLDGLEDLRESLRRSLEQGWVNEARIGFNNVASWVWQITGPADALEIWRQGIEYSARVGVRGTETWTRAENTWALFDLGRWDEVLAEAQVVEADAMEQGSAQPLMMALATKGRVLFYRGHVEEAAAIASDLVPRARAVGDPQIVLPALSLAALVERNGRAAVALIEESQATLGTLYPDSARVCVRHGAIDAAERLIRTGGGTARDKHVGATIRAIVAEARGEGEEAGRLYAEAAQGWEEYGFVLERGLCLLGVAQATGDAGAADEARAIFRSLGAEALAAEAAAA